MATPQQIYTVLSIRQTNKAWWRSRYATDMWDSAGLYSLCFEKDSVQAPFKQHGPEFCILSGPLRTRNCPMITLYVVAASRLRHSLQIWLNPLIRAIILPMELANVRMVAIKSKRSLARCSEFRRPLVNDVLALSQQSHLYLGTGDSPC